MSSRHSEVIVVGGGPAGLSSALYLARYARSVAVFDAGHGRSTHHQVNHNYLGFPGGVPAVKLRELGRQQLGEYAHVTCRDERVASLRRDGEGFVAVSASGEHRAEAVILCTGVRDHYPHFPNWEDYVGRTMFWCLTCDGYANRGRRVVVVGHTDAAACEALQLTRFTDRVTVLTNRDDDDLSQPVRERLDAVGIQVVSDRIQEVRGSGGHFRSITTGAGRELPLEVLFSLQGTTAEAGLAEGLGLQLSDDGWITVNSEQCTNVPGVYAAGDVTRLHAHQVATAVHEGGQAACAANYHLYPPGLRLD
ncbi:MAG: NAD(P)/FAD-dependent oxidoreductase [Candidatus Dormibacteria bacterium]